MSNVNKTLRVIVRLCAATGVYVTLKIISTALIDIIRVKLLYFSLNGKTVTLKTEIFNHPIYVNTRDRGLSEELLTYGIHEPFLSLFMLNEIEEGDFVVEVGANIGYYTLVECPLIKYSGKVIAIEPDPRSMNILRKNINLNGYEKNVETKNVAVGPKKQKKIMILTQSFNLNYILDSAVSGRIMGAKEDTINLDVVSLDELVSNESKIDVIRMDIEGYEFEVLKGMKKTIANFRPRLLIFELHPVANINLMKSFFETLNDFGYEIKWAVPRALMDGTLEVNTPILRATLEVIQGHAWCRKSNLFSYEKVPIMEFAEKFCRLEKMYHIVFTPSFSSDT